MDLETEQICEAFAFGVNKNDNVSENLYNAEPKIEHKFAQNRYQIYVNDFPN